MGNLLGPIFTLFKTQQQISKEDGKLRPMNKKRQDMALLVHCFAAGPEQSSPDLLFSTNA